MIARKNQIRYIAIKLLHSLILCLFLNDFHCLQLAKKAKTKKKGRSLFEDDFEFFSGEPDDTFRDPWNLDAAIKFAKQKQESVS